MMTMAAPPTTKTTTTTTKTCHCGSPNCKCVDCKCTEELCCSLASSLIQALPPPPPSSSSSSSSSVTTTTTSRTPPQCCAGGGGDPLAAAAVLQSTTKPPSMDDNDTRSNAMVEAEFTIDGMSCVNCANAIERKVLQLDGVQSIVINLTTDSAKVQWKKKKTTISTTTTPMTTSSDEINSNRIKDAIEAAGYGVKHVHMLQLKNDNMDCCGNKPRRQPPSSLSTNRTAEIYVGGMSCAVCAKSIETEVHKLSGIHNARAVVATDTLHVSWDDNQTTINDIKEAIVSIGYDVERVEYPPSNHPANNDNVLLEGNDNNNTDEGEAMEERWSRIRRRQDEKVQKKRRAFLWSLVGTFPILVITMGLVHVVKHGFLYNKVSIAGHSVEVKALILWILATPIQFITGIEFYKMTYYNLRNCRAGMDVLVSLGTTAAYGYALVGAFSGDDMSANFFETAAVLICFVLAGKWLQASAVRRTSEALTSLMKLQSKTAVKITRLLPSSHNTTTESHHDDFNPLTDPYSEAVVSIQRVKKGDIVKVLRGSSIPTDGRVIFGAMSVNESMVTGESMPVLKTRGSDVLGGTICVESDQQGAMDSVGASFVEVTGVGSATALAQIIQLVQDAQTRTVPIQTFADTVASIFVPVVCVISLVTYITWYVLCKTKVVPSSWYEDLGENPVTFSLMFGIACLVISCPCALGLATPTAVSVGTGQGAKVGVYMKGGEALEVASKVDSVIFDKTGTLTLGSPSITDFVRVDGANHNVDLSDEYLLWLLGCLERTSEHPLAKAVVSYVEEKLGGAGNNYLEEKPFVEPTEFRALTGRGASAIVLGNVKIAAGNRSFSTIGNFAIPDQAEQAMCEMERMGKTAVLVAVNEVATVVLGLADELKPGAEASIQYLRDVMNVDVWMVTGDNERTAHAVALKLGLPSQRVIADALPSAKLQHVQKLQEMGHLVAMVGDGVNDSPALAQADVGISVGTAAAIATEAADLVLYNGNVEDVCTALHLSRAIFRRIQLNLLWSLLYNVLGIPLAAGVFYPLVKQRLPPTVAALAMALSSVSVVLSSLSLRLYQPPNVYHRQQQRRNNRHDPRRRMVPRTRTASRRGRGVNSNGNNYDDQQQQQDLLSNDFLSTSEVTETTSIIDNRSSTRGGGGSGDQLLVDDGINDSSV